MTFKHFEVQGKHPTIYKLHHGSGSRGSHKCQVFFSTGYSFARRYSGELSVAQLKSTAVVKLQDDVFGERFVRKFNSFQGEKCRMWKGGSHLCAHLARRFI